MYTLLYLKWTTNKDLLYSTGGCEHHSVLSGDLYEKEIKKDRICVYIQLTHFAVEQKQRNIVKQCQTVGQDLATKPPASCVCGQPWSRGNHDYFVRCRLVSTFWNFFSEKKKKTNRDVSVNSMAFIIRVCCLCIIY